MEAMAIYNSSNIIPNNDLPLRLMGDFINFIDRGEKTTRTYIVNLRQFAAWLKYAAISRPTRNDIISYREYLSAEHEAIALDPQSEKGWTYRKDAKGHKIIIHCKPNTIAQYLRSVCQFFRWTAANGYYPNIADNIHAPKINSEQHKKEALTAENVLTIENSIATNNALRIEAASEKVKDQAGRIDRATEQGKRLNAMFLLAVNCGLRTIELSRANIKDIETKNGQAFIYVWGKGHSEADKKKALAPQVMEAISEYLEARTDSKQGNSPLFVSTGNRSGGKRIAPTTISTMLKKAMQQAGFDSERITAHSLRHTTAQNVLAVTGENIHQTQNYLRHASPTTTQIYLRETEKEQQQEADIAQRLYNLYHNQESKTDKKEKLNSILNGLTMQQIEQLTSIAEAMRK